MADGPRCKRRKQANPRRKNGKKTTGETKAKGWDASLCSPLGTVCVWLRGWCAPLALIFLRREKRDRYPGVELCVNAQRRCL